MPKVKPLHWCIDQYKRYYSDTDPYSDARYSVFLSQSDDLWIAYYSGKLLFEGESLEAAQQACQEHWDALVLSWIEEE